MVSTFLVFAALAPAVARTVASMQDRIVTFEADELSLTRKYDLEFCPQDQDRIDRFYQDTLSDLKTIDFDRLPEDGKIDYVFLRNAVQNRIADLRQREINEKKLAPFLPFVDEVNQLELDRRQVVKPDYEALADRVSAIGKQVR